MSGYLRHIELSRQLEERAKEASKARQLAEERLSELQGFVETAKRSDCNVGEAEDLLAQAKGAMAAKDYRLALEKIKDGEDKVRATFLQRVQSILDSSESMLALLKKTDDDTSEYEALMGSARDAIDKGNFEEALETAKRGWSKGEKMLHDYLSRSFSSTQAFILAAKSMDKDTAIAEDLLAKARAALEASDYGDALTQTQEALDLLGRELDYELVEERKAVDQLLEAGKALDIDLSKAESYLTKFDKELEKSEYEKAFNFLKQARSEAERQLKKTIEEGGADLKAPIEEAKKLGVETSTVEGLSKEVLKAANEGDHATASQLIRRGLQELENAKFQRVLKTISLSKPKFLKARELGVDTKSAVEIFNKARQSLQDGDFKDALYRADKGNEVLDQLIEEFKGSQEKMEALSKEVASFVEQGVSLSKVEGLLRTATEELSQGNLKSWSSIVQRIEEDLESVRSERAEELLSETQFLLTFAEKAGLNSHEESEVLHQIPQTLKAGDAGKALQDSLNLKASLEGRITAHLQSKLADIKKILPKGEPEEASEAVLKAQTALSVNDFETAIKMVEEAHAEVESSAKEESSRVLEGLGAAHHLATEHGLEAHGIREAHLAAKKGLDEGKFAVVYEQLEVAQRSLRSLIRGAFEGVKGRVVEVRDSGIDISGMKKKLVEAKAAIDGGDVIQGLVALRDCDLGAKRSLDLYKKVHDTTASAAALIAEGKKKSIDMSGALDLLLKGKSAFESGDLERALELTRDARGLAEKEISVLNVTDRILAVKESLDLAKMLDVDVSVWTKLLERAKQSLEGGDFREAVELAMEAEEQARSGTRDKVNSKVAKAESFLDRVQVPAKEVDDLQKSISDVKALIGERKLREAAEKVQNTLVACEELATAYDGVIQVMRKAEALASELQSMSVRISGPEKLLNKADKAYNDGNIRHAGQLAEEALSQLTSQREESVGRTLKNFEAAVAKAKSEGLNVSSAEGLLGQARSLLKEGNYQDALSAAMQSEAEVEKMGLQKEIAQNALETARTRISSLPNPPTSLAKMLRAAEQAFEGGDYVACLETAISARDEFSKVREAWEQMEGSEEIALKFYKTAERVVSDMTQLQGLWEEAQRATERGDLEGAKASYDELANQAAGLTSSYTTKLNTDVRNALVLCSLLNCEVPGIDDKVSQGRSYADASRFDTAIDILSQAKEEAHAALKVKIEELLSEAVAAADHAARVGVDAKKAREVVEEARAAMDQGHFERAVRLAQESLEGVQSEEEFLKRFMDSSLKAESIIRTSKKFGINVKAAEKSLKQAFELKDSNPDGALKKAQEALESAEGALDAFSPSLAMELDLQNAAAGAWEQATLKLENSGKALAKDVELEVMGNLEVQGLDVPATIRARGEAEARFQVMFSTSGTVPVMVKARAKRVLDSQEYEWERVFDVSVEGPAAGAQSQAVTAEYESKCALCRGAIKKGFAAKRCVCGVLLHEPCAVRAGRCPVCQHGL